MGDSGGLVAGVKSDLVSYGYTIAPALSQRLKEANHQNEPDY